MPVSVAVCESTANAVNAALRDSLGATTGGNGGVGKAAAAATALLHGDDRNDDNSIHSNLVANAKRILLTKIEYEEVENYNDAVLEKMKSKCIVIKPDDATPYHNQHSSTCSINNRNNTNGHDCSTTDTNVNGVISRSSSKSPAPNVKQQLHAKQQQQQHQSQSNPNELPAPKRVLFARENVRIGWKHGFNGRKWNVGVGMMNVGNTCYLNSTLQALFHVPAMANWLLSDSAHMERCDAADAGCIICAMANTLQSSQTNQSAIRPYMVYSKLKAICKHMVMGRQEDAHEFLRFLVESMEKSYLARFRNFKDLDQYSKETTPLNQILGGYLKSAVRCLSCGHVSVTFQHFQDLLLDIRKADTIDEALEGYFSRERLEDTGYKCEACKKKVSATKQFSLERAPIVLCIQLKRFSIVGTKLNKQMTLKPRLDLTKFTSRKTPGEHLTYKLVAMVTHLGVSQHCGHYTAIGLTESGTYYNYDDSYVRPISVQSVCNTSAYIIFYEMDSTNSYRTPSPASSTQVSGVNIAATPTNSPKATNGVRVTNGHLVSPQCIIGPQLPPGGLPNRQIHNKSPSPGQTPKQHLQKQTNMQVTSNVNNKITIHFKNGYASLVKNSGSMTPNAVVGASITQSNGNDSNKPQNGLLMGASKFQESSHSKCSLAGTSNKGQTFAIANGNTSSSNNAYAAVTSSSEDEDANDDDVDGDRNISSMTHSTQRKSMNAATAAASSSTPSSIRNSISTLPSMPKLFDNCTSNGKITLNGTGNSNSGIKQQQLRSLVPYESASDDEDTTTSNTIHNPTTETHAKRPDNPLKRHSSNSSSSTSSDSEETEVQEGSAQKRQTINNIVNHKVAKKSANNTFRFYNATSPTSAMTTSRMIINNSNINGNKQKTDAIDEIFKAHNNNKRNGLTNSNGNHNNLTKKKKSTQQAISKSTMSLEADSEDYSDNETAVKDDGTNALDTICLGPYKRSKSTPPSPPVIKSKVGLWQVTQNDAETTNAKFIAGVSTKNLKNPFASKVSESATTMKRAKLINGKQQEKRVGNGYQQDKASDGAVSELLKQSHRGYGAQVLTWNGTQTDIEKEIIAEAREQRQRDWEHDEDNEQDQGRQRKVKNNKEASTIHTRMPGYNPFQEHENQKRWHKSSASGFYQRFHHTGSHFRHNFHQRSKFKFNRFGGSKFQHHRALQRHVANVNGVNRRQDT